MAKNLGKMMTLRPMDEEDRSFIFSSWIRSYRSSQAMAFVPNAVYYDKQKQLIEYILSRSIVSVAVNYNDDSQIFGWVCFEQEPIHTIHYCYVKQPYRNMGIANVLLVHAFNYKNSSYAITQATHANKNFAHLSNVFEMIFNPFQIWEIWHEGKTKEN